MSSKPRAWGYLRLGLEPLEPRQFLSADAGDITMEGVFDVSAEEQYFIYALSRARHDPVAYQREQSLPVDLSYVQARGPLAVNTALFGSAGFHAEEMAAYNYFAHQSAVTGDWPNKMARDHGYPLPTSWSSDANYIESIAAGYATVQAALSGLIVDEGVPSLGHRNHLLGIDEFNAENREIGVGYAYNGAAQYRYYWAIHATRCDPADRFVTGVAYGDLNANGRYDLGEGLSGATVTVGAQSTTTNTAGGWGIEVTAGTYLVTASGGGLSGTARAAVTIGADNVEVDFISGRPWGIVNFDEAVSAPVAADDRYVATENTAFNISAAGGVLANDGDAQGDSLAAALVTNAAHGTLALAVNGSFVYTPQAGFHGADSFTYRASDASDSSNLATVTILVARPLGTVDFLTSTGENPTSGELWYRLNSSRQGFLTLEATCAAGPTGLGITLYDASLAPLGAATAVDGYQRVDHQASSAGQMYYFRLTGSSPEVALRLSNLVQASTDGTQVSVFGSAGNDTLDVTAGSPLAIVINGVRYTFAGATQIQYTGVHGSGGSGTDSVVFHATSGNETASLAPGLADVTGPGYAAHLTAFASMTLYGGGGNDTLALRDSAGDDQFVGTPTYAALSGPGCDFRAWNFARVEVEATGGGVDVAKFYDSVGNDEFVSASVYNALSGSGFHNQVRYFEGVHAYATAGGTDVAKFYDSAGNDDFVAAPTCAALFAPGFYNRAKFFEAVHAYATAGGTDVAKFYDSAGNDDFVASPTCAALFAPGFYNRAKFFENVHAYATAGGADVARLYDSAGNDTFSATPDEGALYLPGSYYNRAKYFEAVHAFATAGGRDVARLSGSASDDKFYADPTQSALYRPGQYYNRAKYFDEVYASGGDGGYDRAFLYDDAATSDLLEAADRRARMSNAALSLLLEANDFDEVTATASGPGNTTSIQPPLQFQLHLEGAWPTI